MSQIVNVHGVQVPHGIHARRTVVLASDHHGYVLRRCLLGYLRAQRIRCADIGTHRPLRCDYPQLSSDLGRIISHDNLHDTVGIGICGSGIGIGIPASKWQGVYAARCLTDEEARTSRRHNNSNLLCLGADVLSLDEAITIVDAWLWGSFDIVEPYISRFLQTVALERHILLSSSPKY